MCSVNVQQRQGSQGTSGDDYHTVALKDSFLGSEREKNRGPMKWTRTQWLNLTT